MKFKRAYPIFDEIDHQGMHKKTKVFFYLSKLAILLKETFKFVRRFLIWSFAIEPVN
jgi:hypothetical protein